MRFVFEGDSGDSGAAILGVVQFVRCKMGDNGFGVARKNPRVNIAKPLTYILVRFGPRGRQDLQSRLANLIVASCRVQVLILPYDALACVYSD